MRLAAFILSSTVCLFAATRAHACGPYIWLPGEYTMSRFYDADHDTGKMSQAQAVIASWKGLINTRSVKEQDIEEVVNTYTTNEVKKIMQVMRPKNSFAAWIKAQNRQDIIDYLAIAKECESVRAMYNSRWYYPSKEDQVSMTLEDIRDICIERTELYPNLADRYALQAIRAMRSLHDYEGMSAFWDSIEGRIPDGIIRSMCLGHVTRTKFERGDIETAIAEYAKAGDISSLEYCLKYSNSGYGTLDILEYVARYCPDNSYAPKTLQHWFEQMEEYSEFTYADQICHICDLALANTDCKSKAMWLYGKALALDLSGDSLEAVKVNRLAAAQAGPEFIKNSIRVQTIYLDAKTATYNKEYEKRLLNDLQWLYGMIQSNLTYDIKYRTINHSWLLKINSSYYYWNDMFKKIVLGVVCPNMVKLGNEVMAIRLANMADNSLLNLAGTQFRYNLTEFNEFDYSNTLFEMLNHELKVSSILDYLAVLGRPQTDLEKFLDEHSFTDRDYFLDVVATRYLRDGNYHQATQILEQVSTSYQYRLNTLEYMNRDPFKLDNNTSLFDIRDYKFRFAREMEHCQNIINGNYGPDEKGSAMIRMAVGRRASATFAWALTEYSYSHSSYWFKPDRLKKVEVETDDMIKRGLAMIRNPEIKAQELMNQNLRLEVLQHYPNTLAAQQILKHCDEYSDYLPH